MKKYGEKSLFNVLNVLGIGCTLGVVTSCSNNINNKNSYDNVRDKGKGRGGNPQKDNNGKKENPKGQPRSANNSNESKEKITPQVQSKNNSTIPKTVSETQQPILKQSDHTVPNSASEVLKYHSFKDLLNSLKDNKSELAKKLVSKLESEIKKNKLTGSTEGFEKSSPDFLKKKICGTVESVNEYEKKCLAIIGIEEIEKTYDFFKDTEIEKEEVFLRNVTIFENFDSFVSNIDEYFGFDLDELNFCPNNEIVYSISFSLDAENLTQLIELFKCYHSNISTCIDKLKLGSAEDAFTPYPKNFSYSSIRKFNSFFKEKEKIKYSSDLMLQECSSACISSLKEVCKELRPNERFNFRINFRGVDLMHIMLSYFNSLRKVLKNENEIFYKLCESLLQQNIDVKNQNTKNKNEIKILQTEIRTIEEGKNKLNKTIEELEEKCSQLTNENINLKNKITQKESEHHALQKDYEQLEEDIDKQKESFQEQAKEVNKVYLEVLNPIIDEMEDKEKEIQKLKEKKKIKIHKLNDKIQKLKIDSEIKIQNLQQEVKSAKNDYFSLKKQHAETDNLIIRDVSYENGLLREENYKLQEQNREYENIIKEHEEKIKKMKEQLTIIWAACQSDKEQGEK